MLMDLIREMRVNTLRELDKEYDIHNFFIHNPNHYAVKYLGENSGCTHGKALQIKHVYMFYEYSTIGGFPTIAFALMHSYNCNCESNYWRDCVIPVKTLLNLRKYSRIWLRKTREGKTLKGLTKKYIKTNNIPITGLIPKDLLNFLNN